MSFRSDSLLVFCSSSFLELSAFCVRSYLVKFLSLACRPESSSLCVDSVLTISGHDVNRYTCFWWVFVRTAYNYPGRERVAIPSDFSRSVTRVRVAFCSCTDLSFRWHWGSSSEPDLLRVFSAWWLLCLASLVWLALVMRLCFSFSRTSWVFVCVRIWSSFSHWLAGLYLVVSA